MPLSTLLPHLRGVLDSIDDPYIACAPAEIARDCFLDLVAGRPRFLVQQRAGGDQHPRRADATLSAAAFEERLLKRIESSVAGESVDGQNRATLNLTNGHQAGLDHFTIDNH